MAASVRIKYVGPFAEGVAVDGVGEFKRNKPRACPAAVAGKAPSVETVKDPDGEVEYEVSHPGYGLLAQTDNFVAAASALDLTNASAKALKEHAAEHGIDLGDATTRDQIAAAIEAAGQSEES